MTAAMDYLNVTSPPLTMVTSSGRQVMQLYEHGLPGPPMLPV